MLELALKDDRREYTPGEAIEGVVRWSDEKTPRGLTVSLVYRTEGRGTQDSATVAEESLAPNGGPGEVSFRVKAPEAPYTFDGSLISLRWYVVAGARGETVEAAITVSPWVQPLRLKQITEPSPLELLKQQRAQQQQQQ